MRFDIYQNVTDQIIAMLEQGVVPWRSPILGRQSAGLPRNLDSRKEYRGINSFLLAFTAWANGYESSYWLTFNQAKQKQGSVRKGEKSSLVIFWKQYETTDKETSEPTTVPVLRYYRVFNVAQCEGIQAPDAATFTPIDFKPIDTAETIVTGYAYGPSIEHGGSRAFYRPSTDSIRLPEPTRFASGEEYYATCDMIGMHSFSPLAMYPLPDRVTRTPHYTIRWSRRKPSSFTSSHSMTSFLMTLAAMIETSRFCEDPQDELNAVIDAEPIEHSAEVGPHCRNAQVEVGSDFLIAHATKYAFDDSRLLGGERERSYYLFPGCRLKRKWKGGLIASPFP